MTIFRSTIQFIPKQSLLEKQFESKTQSVPSSSSVQVAASKFIDSLSEPERIKQLEEQVVRLKSEKFKLTTDNLVRN